MERRSVQAIIAALNAAGVRYLIAGGLAVVSATFLSLGDLLRLKERARRPQDMLDIEKLRALHKETSGE